jgi:hypothetical protein
MLCVLLLCAACICTTRASRTRSPATSRTCPSQPSCASSWSSPVRYHINDGYDAPIPDLPSLVAVFLLGGPHHRWWSGGQGRWKSTTGRSSRRPRRSLRPRRWTPRSWPTWFGAAWSTATWCRCVAHDGGGRHDVRVLSWCLTWVAVLLRGRDQGAARQGQQPRAHLHLDDDGPAEEGPGTCAIVTHASAMTVISLVGAIHTSR